MSNADLKNTTHSTIAQAWRKRKTANTISATYPKLPSPQSGHAVLFFGRWAVASRASCCAISMRYASIKLFSDLASNFAPSSKSMIVLISITRLSNVEIVTRLGKQTSNRHPVTSYGTRAIFGAIAVLRRPFC